MAYKIESKIPKTNFQTRNIGKGKIGPKPANFGQTQLSKTHLRSKAYENYPKIPEVITQIEDPKKFKKWYKKYLKNPKDLPPIKKT